MTDDRSKSLQPASPDEAGTILSKTSLPSHLRYIAVEGVIGVGKTSLARHLAERFGGGTVLEEVEENPFLPAFYSDPERWAFHTQLTYLASRYRQQKELQTHDLFHEFVVSDYTFDKDRIFAHLNLHGDELKLYETLYTLMEMTIPAPDLIIYLQANLDRVMANIRKRARPYETKIERSYLASLVEAYDFYFARYKGPLLRINVSAIDFVHSRDDRERLVRTVVNFPRG